MASKTYHVGFSGVIHRLDNLNFDPGGNTYTNWVDLKPYFNQSFNQPSYEYETFMDVMTIPGNKDKVFIVGSVRQYRNYPWRGIAYSTTAGQNTANPNQSFITPGFPGGAVPSHISNYQIATESAFFFYEVWCTDANTVYACGDDACVIRSIDGGTNFTLHTIPHALFGQNPGTVRPSATSIHFDTPSDGVVGTAAVGGVPFVFTSTTGNSSCTWLPTAAVPAATGILKGIYKKGKLIVAVGSAKIICSIDGGATWITQYTWSELGYSPYVKNGEHLTWHYEPCSETVYFRATGRRNEIVQTAYRFGSVNSFVDPLTGVTIPFTAPWSVFNGHIYDPTIPSQSNPAKNYAAAHFYRPYEGFLGRTDTEFIGISGIGYRRIDRYLNNAEIPNVDTVPPQNKDESVTAIWTELDPVVYYSIKNCKTGETLYVNVNANTANIASLLGQTVSGITIDGDTSRSCWTVQGPIQCVNEQLSDVNTLSAVTRSGCDDDECNYCYKLIACQPEVGQNGQTYFPSVVVYSNSFDLEDYLYKVFTFSDDIQGICPGKCFYLTKSLVCETTPVVFPSSYSLYDSCEECLPKCPVELNTRSVKPGFYTPGCPPDYTVKTSCMYAEQVYDEMVSIRYGINICCDHDIDRWDIKKQLLDLKALYDECLCVSAICPVCVEPCNVEATISVYEVTPLVPPVDPCNTPSGPVIITLREAPACYVWNFELELTASYGYMTDITINDTVYDLTTLVTAPFTTAIFPVQLVSALNSFGIACSGAYWTYPFGPLIINEIIGTVSNASFEIVPAIGLPSVFEQAPSLTECLPLPEVPCYSVSYQIDTISGCNIGNITLFDGTTTTTYVPPSPVSLNDGGAITSYLTGLGYDVTSVTGGLGLLQLTFGDGSIPVALVPTCTVFPPSNLPPLGFYFVSGSPETCL